MKKPAECHVLSQVVNAVTAAGEDCSRSVHECKPAAQRLCCLEMDIKTQFALVRTGNEDLPPRGAPL